MPIYEYRCDACGEMSEALQKVDEPDLDHCPKCGSPKLRRVMSATVFRLKGSGWYETDFKSGDRHNVYGEDGGQKTPAKTEAGSPTQPDGGASAPPAEAHPSPSPGASVKPDGVKKPAPEKPMTAKPEGKVQAQPAKPAHPGPDS